MANKLLKWVVLLALALFVVAMVIFFFGRPSFSENQVVLELNGPTQASVGDEVIYKVKYGNNTNVELHNLKLKFTYPEGAIVIKDDKILKDLSETVELEKLSSGKSQEKEFRAFLTGDRGNIKNAKVELEFKAGSLRSFFEKSETISTTLISVPVSLTLVAPPTVVSGQTINYILDYRNESNNSISDIKLELDYPDGFEIQEQSPKPAEAKGWLLPVLKRNEGGRINIKGIIKGKEGEIKTISASLKRNIGGEFVDYQKTSSSSVISNPLLSLEILANNSKNYSAHLDDKIEYTVKYKNNSTSNIIGLNLEVKLDGEMYDLEKLNTSGGFYNSSNGTILWNAAVVPDFSVLSPNKSGEVKFSVGIKSSFPTGSASSRNFFVKISADLTSPNVPSGFDGDEVSAAANLINKISTQPSFLQIAFYDDPAFGSSGPLPPKVEKETVFTIHWQIINPGNDMNKVELKGVLPPGVKWRNVVSVGLNQPEPIFNPNSSEVVWNIGVLPQGTGILSPKYEASFQVSITPSVSGQTPVIIKNSKLSGFDSFTKEEVVLNASDLTTDELVDRPGEGTVE